MLSRFVCLVLTQASLAFAQWPTTELTALSRSAAQVGTETDVAVLAGNQLDEIDRLVFSHPEVKATLLTDDPKPYATDRQPRYKQFHLTIPGNIPTGFYEARVGGRFGLSNPRLFLIGGLPALVLDGASNSGTELPKLPLQTLVQGKTTASAVTSYRLEIPQGAKWRVDCLAQRIDSQLLPVLTIRDQRGRELARHAGTDEQDAMCLCTAVDGQPLTVTVHDALFRGGDEFAYQMLATPVDQPSAQVTELVQLFSGQSVATKVPGDGRVSPDSLGYVATPTLDPAVPLQVHDESQFKNDASQSITLPMVIQGGFETRRDVDRFQFAGQPGHEWVFEIVSDRMGSPADTVMRIERLEPQPSGELKRSTVADQDDPPLLGDASFRIRLRDPMIRFNPPAPGDYQLVLRDLDNGSRGIHDRPYRLLIREVKPDFSIICFPPALLRDVTNARPATTRLLRGGQAALRVVALRQDGFAEPIEIEVQGLPMGVQASKAVLHSNQQEVQLILSAREDAAAWEGKIKVIGRNAKQRDTHFHEATAATMARANAPGRARMSGRRSTDLWINVSDQDLSPLSIALGKEEVVETSRGGSVKLPVHVTRRSGGEQNCVLRPRDLPAGVTAPEVTVNGDKAEGEIEFKIGNQSAPGDYTLWMQAEAKVKLAVNPQAFQRAEAYRKQLQSLLDDPARSSEKDAIMQAIKQADGAIEQAKAGNQPRELTVFIPTTSALLRIHEAPFEIGSPAAFDCPINQSTQVAFELRRCCGFDGVVECSVVSGLENSTIQVESPPIAAGNTTGTLKIQVPADATPMERQLKLKLVYTFNNQKLEVQRTVTIRIVPPPPSNPPS